MERNWNKTIFLGHASEDKAIVRNLYKQLAQKGFEPWLDEEDLLIGQKWDVEIKNALSRSRFFLALLSSNSVPKDGYVQRELKMALDEMEEKPPRQIYFIPALLENIPLPDITVGTVNLRDYHAISLFEAGGLDKLISQLQRVMGDDAHQASPEQGREEEQNKTPLETIQWEMAQGRMESALKKLLDYVKLHDEDRTNDVIHQLARYNRLRKMESNGVVGFDDMSREDARIWQSTNNIVSQLIHKS